MAEQFGVSQKMFLFLLEMQSCLYIEDLFT